MKLSTNKHLIIGLSVGGYILENYVKHHNFVAEKDEMYLFSEIVVNEGNANSYPHFEIRKLRKDLPKNEYHDYFNKCIEIGKKISSY